MGAFINYAPALFPNLTYNQQVILESSANTIYVNSITVCNTSSNDIRINLIKKIIGSNLSSDQTFLIKNFEIPMPATNKISTVELVSYFGLNEFMPVYTVNGITYTGQLIIYSNGINQNFDCSVNYSAFVETPIRF